MTWLSRIFSRSTAAAVLLGVPAVAATVSGSVQPVDSRDPSVRHHDYSGIVVWLDRRDGAMQPPEPKLVQMAQKNKRFVPQVLAVPVGSTVTFPNFDPIFHNVFSTYSGQIFD